MSEPCKFTLCMSKTFEFGWTIYDPFYDGFFMSFVLGFFRLNVWSKPTKPFSFINCWDSDWEEIEE
jgi:hypothetical protein